MKPSFLFVVALTSALVGAVAQGCSPAASGEPEVEKNCEPGGYVFCRCADGSRGTKLCREDGLTFEACGIGENRPCPGGEVPDPDTGKPIERDASVEQEASVTKAACPGTELAVNTSEVVVEGDTAAFPESGQNGETGSACDVGGTSPEQIYEVKAKVTGTLEVVMEPFGTLDPTMYLRFSCDKPDTQYECQQPLGVGQKLTSKKNVIKDRSYFLVVDGRNGSSGKFKITAKIVPKTVTNICGDGFADTNEACDDGNNTDGDGCNASCGLASGGAGAVTGTPPSADKCPGQPVHVWDGKTVTGSGTTVGLGNDEKKTGSSCLVSGSDVNAANDRVYEVTAHKAGTLVVTVTPKGGFQPLVYARTKCDDPASQGADGSCGATPRTCSRCGGGTMPEILSFPVTAGEKRYVFVDGHQNQTGEFDIAFTIQ